MVMFCCLDPPWRCFPPRSQGGPLERHARGGRVRALGRAVARLRGIAGWCAGGGPEFQSPKKGICPGKGWKRG